MESSPREWPAARRQLGIIVVAVAALLVGLAAGYAVGARHGPGRAAPPVRSRSAAAQPGAASSSAIPGGLALSGEVAVQQDHQCSAQIGGELQLGVQVVNQSAQGMVLRRLRPVLPLGGLQEVTSSWGPCGELPRADAAGENVLAPHGSAWFTVTFRVLLLPCPAPIPVQFAVTFEFRHQLAAGPRLLITSRLPGFVDLGSVPYSGCSPAS